MEKLYQGSDGVKTRIYGFAEAVPALAAAQPVTPPAPVVTPEALVFTAFTTTFILSATEGRTYLGSAVDTSILDVKNASAEAGIRFRVILRKLAGTSASVAIATTPGVAAVPVVLAPAVTYVVLEFITVGNGATALLATTLSPV